MAMSNLRAIAGALIAAGRSPNEPAAAIQWGSTDREHRVTGTLTSIASQCDEDGVRNPAVVVIGPVVALAPLLSGGATLAVPAMAPIQG